MSEIFDWRSYQVDQDETPVSTPLTHVPEASLNVIRGSNQDDTPLNGTGGDDKIFGRGGEDSINGKKGDDVIISGHDNDFIRGGGGADTFVFRTGDDQDQIADYSLLDGDGLDLRGAQFGIEDLKDRDAGGDITDHDHDGAYLRESSSNGQPEVTFYFGHDEGGFDSLTITGISIKQIVKDIEKHPDHYDFFS